MGLERGLAMGLMVLWQAAELRLLEAVGLVQSGQIQRVRLVVLARTPLLGALEGPGYRLGALERVASVLVPGLQG